MNLKVYKIYANGFGYYIGPCPSYINFQKHFNTSIYEGTEYKTKDQAKKQLINISKSKDIARLSKSFLPEIHEIELIATVKSTVIDDIKPTLIDNEIVSAISSSSKGHNSHYNIIYFCETLRKNDKFKDVQYIVQIKKSQTDRFRAGVNTAKSVRDQLKDAGISSRMYNYSRDMIAFRNKEHALLAKLSIDVDMEFDLTILREKAIEKLK